MKKIMIFLLLFISAICLSACGKENDKTLTEMTGFMFEEAVKNEESFILVIYQTGCSHCEEYMPIFEEVMSKYDVDAYKINLAGLTDQEKGFLQSYVTVSGTPTTVFFEKGSETSSTDRLVGNQSKTKIIKKLKSLGYIREEE